MRMSVCTGCGKERMVNLAYGKKNEFLGEFCADCYEKSDIPPAPRNKTSKPATKDENPAWENVVDAYEEGLQ